MRVVVVVVDSEPVSDAAERLRRLLAGPAATSSPACSSAVSSSSAIRRPRLRVVEDVDASMGEGVGAWVLVRAVVLRCLLVDCFAFAFALVLVLLVATLAAVRDEEAAAAGGSEPTVAVVEIWLNDERADASLVMDLVEPMVAIVEVLRSADGLGMMLDGEVDFEMVSSMLAIAYVLKSGLGRRAESAVEEVVIGPRATGVCLALDRLPPAGMPCTRGELLVPAPGLDDEEATRMPRGSPPCSMSFHIGSLNSLARLLYSRRPVPPGGAATTPSYTAVPGIAWSSRPCLARQRGALRPKRGIEACIGSSFFVPLFIEGWSGKSWNVSGTPI
jgi:hypothetical protein